MKLVFLLISFFGVLLVLKFPPFLICLLVSEIRLKEAKIHTLKIDNVERILSNCYLANIWKRHFLEEIFWGENELVKINSV